MNISLSIVIPVHNEEEHIVGATDTFLKYFKKRKDIGKFELILCENGSTDNTLSLANNLAKKYSSLKVIHIPQRAIGQAIRAGIKESRYGYIYLTGIDNPFAFVDLGKFLTKINAHDIVFASKNHPQSVYQAPLSRILASKTIYHLHRILFSTSLTDSQSNFLARKKSLLRILPFCTSYGPFFQTQIGIYATLKKLNITEIPVQYLSGKRTNRFKVSDGLNLVRELIIERLKISVSGKVPGVEDLRPG